MAKKIVEEVIKNVIEPVIKEVEKIVDPIIEEVKEIKFDLSKFLMIEINGVNETFTKIEHQLPDYEKEVEFVVTKFNEEGKLFYDIVKGYLTNNNEFIKLENGFHSTIIDVIGWR